MAAGGGLPRKTSAQAQAFAQTFGAKVDAREPAARAGGSAQPGLPQNYGNPKLLSKADTQALGIANSHLAIALPHLAGRLGQELVGIGPGMYKLGKGEAQDVAAATKGNLGFKNTKAFAKATGQSFKETVTHPVRQFENDPLGLLTNVSLGLGAAGRVASIGDSLRAGEIGKAAKAVVKRPLPPKRTLKVGGREEVHPNSSLNLGVAHLQSKVIDPIVQRAIDNPEGALAKTLNPGILGRHPIGRLVGPEVKVGREMRLEGQFDQARLSGPTRELSKYGTATPGRLSKTSGDGVVSKLIQKVNGKRLTAAQQKAVQIIASGKPVESHLALHTKAIENGVGDVNGHTLHAALTEGAAKHLDDPLVLKAAAAARKAISQRETLRAMTEDEILHRLGAHATAIDHGANGFEGASPVQELVQLQADAKKMPPGAELDQANARIQQLNDHLIGEGAKARENGAFYLPVDRGMRKTTFLPHGGGNRVSQGDYGASPPKLQPNHRYEGKAIAGGKFRSDATNQAMRSLQLQIKDHTALKRFESLFAQGTEDPAVYGGHVLDGGNAFALRDVKTVPADLKEFVNQVSRGDIKPGEYDTHLQKVVEGLINQDIKPGEHVRYVHQNRVGPLKPYEPLFGRAMDKVDRFNQAIRMGRYGPSYLKWLPQNLVVNMGEQGVHIVRNARTLLTTINHLDSPDYNTLAALSGDGPANALMGDTQFLHKAQTKAAGFWTKVDDHMSRMLQLTHELHREGVKTPEEMSAFAQKLRDPNLKENDPAAYQLGMRIWKRANDKAINYTITNVERATLKKLMVAWPWTRGASTWAGRFFVDHPVQGKMLAQAGKQGDQSNRQFYEKLGGYEPSYLEATIPAGLAHGVDTSFLNIMETPGAFGEGLSGASPGGSLYRGELARELMPAVVAAIDQERGTNKSGAVDKSGTAPLVELLKSFTPASDLMLGLGGGNPKAATKTFTPGVNAALSRFFGSPYSPINQESAAVSGYRSATENLPKADMAKIRAQVLDAVIQSLGAK